MSKEIERKYLVDQIPNDLDIFKQQEIEQTYLAYNETESIRVRRIDNEKHTMTFKAGTGLVRDEIDFAINGETYNQLLENSQLIALRKTRLKINHKNHTYDLDIYHNTRALNLKTVEIEFPSEEEALRFVAPTWFGKEVTGESMYLNQNLWLELQNQK